MIPLLQRPFFQAQWNATNIHFQEKQLTCLQKIIRVVREIFSNIISLFIPLIVTKLMNRFLLPAAHYPLYVKQQVKAQHEQFWHGEIKTPVQRLFRNHYTALEHTVATPDGSALLDATYYKHRDANETTPTIICFQPNGQLKDHDTFRWMQEYAIHAHTPCNFAIFDYRSVGGSKGKFKHPNDLIVDGSSIVQWVESLGVSKNRIHFYGYSLGGAIAVQTQALDPELIGTNGNERSLSSLSDMIHNILGPTRLRCLIPKILKIANYLKYELNNVAAFEKLRGRKIVIFHPLDPVIPYEASLAKGVEELPHERVQLEHLFQNVNHHCIPLNQYVVNGQNVNETIGRFMISPAVAAI